MAKRIFKRNVRGVAILFTILCFNGFLVVYFMTPQLSFSGLRPYLNENRTFSKPPKAEPQHVVKLRKACAIPREVNTACPDLSIQRNDTQNNETATNPSNFTSKFSTINCSLLELTRDCRLFREIHGYNDKPVEEEEKGFPLAFSIKMHSEPEQAEQLLRVIYRPHNVYCIHVDAKAAEVAFKVMVAVARCLDNVHMAPGRVHYVYKSYDVIRAELRNMACALQSTIDWRYYLNVAGQEMPLRTNLEMVRVLQLLNGTNDIESFPVPGENRKHFTNIYNISKNGKYVMTNTKKEPPPFAAEIRKGTQYGAFSREFVTSLFYDETVRKVMDFFKDTFDPDEKIWATVNQLPWIPGGYPVHVRHSPSNQHISKAVAWKKSDSYRCKGSYVRSVCIFTIDDLPWLLQQPNFFANKFYPKPQSLAAAECLEAVIGQRARSRDVLLDQSYYQNLPHVKYRRDVIVAKNSSSVITGSSKGRVEKVEDRKNNKKM